MKVKKLIEKLQQLNPNAEVRYVWDGEARSLLSYVWVATSGAVILCDDFGYVGDLNYAPEGMVKDKLSFLTGRQCAMHFNKGKKDA